MMTSVAFAESGEIPRVSTVMSKVFASLHNCYIWRSISKNFDWFSVVLLSFRKQGCLFDLGLSRARALAGSQENVNSFKDIERNEYPFKSLKTEVASCLGSIEVSWTVKIFKNPFEFGDNI